MTEFAEQTARELLDTHVTAHDQKFYDERMTSGDNGCYLANVAINRRRGSLAIVVKVQPTDGSPVTVYNSKLGKGKANYYTVRLRWLDAEDFMGDIEDWLLCDSAEKLWRIGAMIENCDVEVWSNSIDWLMQGRWEWAAQSDYSYYKYSGPQETGRWLAIKGSKHTLSKHMIELLDGLVHKTGFSKAIKQALEFVYEPEDFS